MALPAQLRIGPRPYIARRVEQLRETPYERIDVKPLSPIIGAEIGGVDLRKLDDETFAEIARAHREYRVVFFRGQHLSVPEQIAFAQRFGELEEHPFLPAREGHGEVIRFEKSEEVVGVENQWHSDVSWREVPSLGSVLHAVDVPPLGGDTLFADMVAAYECLEDDLKERIAGLTAVHDFINSFGLAMTPEQREEKRKELPPAEHPVVRQHPETGEKALYVNAIFTSHIVGMEADESRALLDLLCRQAEYPEYQCRFHWEPGSVAFWDNRMVQHYAANDYWPARRVMERVTVIGERPV